MAAAAAVAAAQDSAPGGMVELPAGRSATPLAVSTPGATLRARSPDEVIARDVVLGRIAGLPAPDLVVCVADATNMRLCLRLLLEAKRTGRPLLLALNMIVENLLLIPLLLAVADSGGEIGRAHV